MGKINIKGESSRLAETAKLERPAPSSSEFGSGIGKSARLERKKQERLVMFSVAGVIMFFGVLGWATDGRIFTAPWEAVMQFEGKGNVSRSAAVNCRLSANKNTPYCRNRKARVEGEWNGIMRGGGKQSFSLHGR